MVDVRVEQVSGDFFIFIYVMRFCACNIEPFCFPCLKANYKFCQIFAAIVLLTSDQAEF